MIYISWKVGLLIVILAIIGCQSQTFQYSRGWTNGKRSGSNTYAVNQQQLPLSSSSSSSSRPALGTSGSGNLINQLYDDGPVIGIPIDDSAIPLSASQGLFRLFPNIATRSDGKSRSIDYSQFLTRKLGNGSNPNRKPPMWIVSSVDQADSGSNNNNNNDDLK